jgi:hypothetical protein
MEALSCQAYVVWCPKKHEGGRYNATKTKASH